MNLQKYITAVNLMNNVVEAAKQPIPEGGSIYTLPCKAWDELYEFIYPNFDSPVSAHKEVTELADKKLIENEIQECQDMLRIGDMDVILEKIKALPPEFTDMVFPVAIARFLLCIGWDDRRGKIAIAPAKLTTFDEFHKRYGKMIISSAQRRRY